MIRLNPEALALLKSAPGSGLPPSGRARLTVLEVSGKTITISLNGVRLKAISDIPIRKGDVFMVRHQREGDGLRLKIISRGLIPGSERESGLARLMENDPALGKALIESGLKLSDERISRFRRLLKGKRGYEREESARELALWEEKTPAFWGLPLGFPQESSTDEESDDSQSPAEKWRTTPLTPGGTARFLKRSSTPGNSYQLFNHTRGEASNHWLRLPFRVHIQGTTYKGELRLQIPPRAETLANGALKLAEERDPEQFWLFAMQLTGEERIDLLHAPRDLPEKDAEFTEKVRKVGFNLVDTLYKGQREAKGFDGYSYRTESVTKGFDTEV